MPRTCHSQEYMRCRALHKHRSKPLYIAAQLSIKSGHVDFGFHIFYLVSTLSIRGFLTSFPTSLSAGQINMKFSTVFALVASFGLVNALPKPVPESSENDLEARAGATCLPNYQGANLYISSTATKARWTVKTLKDSALLKTAKAAKNTWRIERTGFPQEDFIIK